jgi:hypothetical protein
MANISATAPVWPGVVAGVEFSYAPRCIRHDISVPLAKTWAGDEHSVDILTNPLYQTGIGAFQDRLQFTGNDTVGYYGLHQYGHFSVNGDPGGDVCLQLYSFFCVSRLALWLTINQVLQLPQRAHVLAPPWKHRSHVVDLAEPAARCPCLPDCGNSYDAEQPSQCQCHYCRRPKYGDFRQLICSQEPSELRWRPVLLHLRVD